MNKKVTVEMSIEHAQALIKATELMTRLGLGQIEYLAELVKFGEIPFCTETKIDQSQYDNERMIRENAIESFCAEIKVTLGFPRGGSRGIGHKANSKTTGLCWELEKSVNQALSMDRDPNPKFRGVNYDGNLIQYSGLEFPVTTIKIEDE